MVKTIIGPEIGGERERKKNIQQELCPTYWKTSPGLTGFRWFHICFCHQLWIFVSVVRPLRAEIKGQRWAPGHTIHCGGSWCMHWYFFLTILGVSGKLSTPCLYWLPWCISARDSAPFVIYPASALLPLRSTWATPVLGTRCSTTHMPLCKCWDVLWTGRGSLDYAFICSRFAQDQGERTLQNCSWCIVSIAKLWKAGIVRSKRSGLSIRWMFPLCGFLGGAGMPAPALCMASLARLRVHSFFGVAGIIRKYLE